MQQGSTRFPENLAGKGGLITGAASGMGRAAALHLARCGARLALADRAEAGLREVAEAIVAEDGPDPAIYVVDVCDPQTVGRMALAARDFLGRLDFLVHCAAILKRTPFLETTLEEWDQVMAVNLRGTFLINRAVAPIMVAQGGGAIVNLASLAGRTPALLGNVSYTASKHGVVGLSRQIARELGPRGVRVNVFCPGATATPMSLDLTGEAERQRISAATPLGRWGDPAEQARAIAFLVSEASSFMTGACLDSNGGALMI